MKHIHTIPALLLIGIFLSPLPARSDIIFDPNTPSDPIATSTPEDSGPPVDWVGEVEWGCEEGWEADGTPFTHCGLGRYRRLCDMNAGVSECHVFFELQESPSVSSVLFLPGIKGSRLYANETQLWEPSGKEDIMSLFLTEKGRSQNTGVYAKAGDLLSETFGHEFYTSFFNDLDSFRNDGMFGEQWTWEAAAYDWRLSLNDIVTFGFRDNERIFYNQVNEMPYIERLLRELAVDSPTGKVSIVAHSNGGLVAKALMRHLGDVAPELVDRIIFVGVPQSGAPRALAAALFGYGEALPFDSCADWTGVRYLCSLLVDRETARMFAEYSPMTYHLLPSAAYFEATRNDGQALASFSGQTLYAKEREHYGSTIDTASELYDYALAVDGGRTRPMSYDLKSPNVLSTSLIGYARNIHADLDVWMPPPGVDVYQIAGWGKETLSGIQFYEEPSVLGLIGEKEAMYRPVFTQDGDGIVPVKSALMYENNAYWVDLTHTDMSHADLLEIPDVRTYIRDVLTETSTDLPSRISTSKPSSESEDKILFFLHSPLTLGLYDENGKYTGLQKNGEVTMDAPGVEYGEFGEVKYLIAPANHTYEVVMEGLSHGTFTLEILEREGNDIATSSSIVNVPTTPTTVATLTVPKATDDISDLRIDYEGDGEVDLSITPKLGEPVILEEVPSEPSSAPERNSSEDSSSSKETAEGSLLLAETTKTGTTTTSSAVTEELEPEILGEYREKVELPPGAQTASAYDASTSIPYIAVIVFGSLLLLLCTLRKGSSTKPQR